MKGRDRQKLTDLGDIYLSNQNVGARAVRECIATILPTWFTEEAQDRCRATLEKGEGKPLPERITTMVGLFGEQGIKIDQLEARTGKQRSAWGAGEVASLAVDYTSITRDGLDKDEIFPPRRVTADEIAKAPTLPLGGAA